MPCGHFFPLPASKKSDACPKDLCPVSTLSLQEASGSLPRLFPVSSAARMTGPCLHPHLRLPVCPGISVPEPFTKPAAFFRAGAFSEQAFDKGGALWNSAPCRQCFPFPSGLLPNVRGRGRLAVCQAIQALSHVPTQGVCPWHDFPGSRHSMPILPTGTASTFPVIPGQIPTTSTVFSATARSMSLAAPAEAPSPTVQTGSRTAACASFPTKGKTTKRSCSATGTLCR